MHSFSDTLEKEKHATRLLEQLAFARQRKAYYGNMMSSIVRTQLQAFQHYLLQALQHYFPDNERCYFKETSAATSSELPHRDAYQVCLSMHTWLGPLQTLAEVAVSLT